MAHFAKLETYNDWINGETHEVVKDVLVVNNEDCLDSDGNESEAVGVAFLQGLFGADTVWKQTSYNTQGGVHKLDGTPLRQRYALIDGTYDATKDVFIEPQPYPSWSLNSDNEWVAPIGLPADALEGTGELHLNPQMGVETRKLYRWDEEDYLADNSTGWVEL